MSYTIGMVIGSILGMGILSLILSLFAYKKSDPWPRALKTVGTAYIIAVIVYGSQDGGRYGEALLFYGIGAAVMLWERHRHYKKHWTDEEQDSELTDVFR